MEKTKSVQKKVILRFPKTLAMLNALRQEKERATQERVNFLLDEAYKECKTQNELTLFKRILVHIGDINRQHELLRKMGIKSANGGSQERIVFRKILKWWANTMPESFIQNLDVFVNFTVYENLMFFEIKTDRWKGNVLSIEDGLLLPNEIYKFLGEKIANKQDIALIARHLPSYTTGNYRTAVKKIEDKRKKDDSFKWSFPDNRDDNFWLKLNGVPQDLSKGHIIVKQDDIISFPRRKQEVTIKKQEIVNAWIKGFCNHMGWEISDYLNFRKLQNTPEQSFSKKSILDFSEEQLFKTFDNLTSGQRFRVHSMLLKKNGSIIEPKQKWGNVAKAYLKWEKQQEQVAQNIRNAQSEGDENAVKKLSKDLKVKATGKQTTDLILDLFNGKDKAMVDTTYTALSSKLNLEATVFPIIDGSGSMDSSWNTGKLTPRQIAYTLAITFATLNPVEKFRNSYGWFSNHFSIVGPTKFKNFTPNPYVSHSRYHRQVKTGLKIDAKNTFSDNYSIISASDPNEVASTNLWSVIEYFVTLVQNNECNVEDLPNCLLFLTDTEYNTGSNTKQAMEKANSIGWNPLCVMWCIGLSNETRMNEFAQSIPNLLFVNGYNEGVLTQVLRNIKNGSINPDMELEAISSDVRYSVVS